MLKILIISPRYTGGIGGHASMLASKLIEYGFDVKKMNVPHIPIKNLKNPSFAVFGTLKGLFSRENYDIVHSFNLPSVFAMRYTRGRKKILSLHGVFSEQIKTLHSSILSSIASNTETRVLKWVDRLTTDSHATQKSYKTKLGYDLEYLPSAIDTSKFNDLPQIRKIENQIAYVGRDSYEKGIDILRKIEPEINGKVVYCTNLPWIEAMKTLSASVMLVVPSRMESLPTIIKEAFYLKIPVIATNVGGIPELISHNETGVLVDPENPKQLRDAINNLIEKKDLAKRLTLNAYDFVTKNLTWDSVLPKYIKFYENLLA
jgi:glycosyltransferase involved in cell wall biosynthesis